MTLKQALLERQNGVIHTSVEGNLKKSTASRVISSIAIAPGQNSPHAIPATRGPGASPPKRILERKRPLRFFVPHLPSHHQLRPTDPQGNSPGKR